MRSPPTSRAMTAQPYRRKRRTVVLTSNYTLTAADDECTFIANGAGAITLTIPAGLPLGFRFRAVQASSSQNFIIATSGSERIRNSNAATSSGPGTATWTGAAAATLGCMMDFERCNTFNGDYIFAGHEGTIPTLA